MIHDDTTQTTRLINSVISSSTATRFFPTKWRTIQTNLEKLNSSLTALTADDTAHSPDLSKLLEAITTTLTDAQTLAERCCDEYYSGGKLQLRSDLDVVISRINLHMKKLDDVFSSGTVMHSRAIVLSRPGAGASRDQMKMYVKDLFSRIRIGGGELRSEAMFALNEIISEDEKYVSVVADEVDDGIRVLVKLLESGDSGVQEMAAEAIAAVARFDIYRGELVAAGAVGPLIRVMETGSERACRAMKRVTANGDNSWSVSAQGGVSACLKICRGVDSNKELIASSLSVLKNISTVWEIKRFMVDEGVVSVLSTLLKSDEDANRIQAVDFLAHLAYEDENVKQLAVKEGVTESLVQILNPNSNNSSKAREFALRAIDILCYSSPTSTNILLASGFLDRLLFFIRNGEVTVIESALKSVTRLCSVSDEAKKSMGDLGFMPELVNLLETKSYEVKEFAAEALCSLISVQRNRRRLLQQEHNVSRILQLLGSEEKPVATKKLLLSALLALSDSNSGRKRIVASGYVKNLEKLADNDVSDAKKIVKKLSGNRLRNMLNGIWSS